LIIIKIDFYNYFDTLLVIKYYNLMSKQYYENISKSFTWLLRHGVIEKDLNISPDGYVLVDDILRIKEFNKYTVNDVKYIVKINDKQRFGLKEENKQLYIRAHQGHSTEVGSKIVQEELLTKLTEPLGLIVHNTTYQKYDEIKQYGFKKNRANIQFGITSSSEEEDIISRNRDITLSPQEKYIIPRNRGISCNKTQNVNIYERPVRIYLDMGQAMKDGVEFYISQNKIICSPGIGDEGLIDKKYISKVIDKKNGKEIDQIYL
jgi:2'-phosphotransferase